MFAILFITVLVFYCLENFYGKFKFDLHINCAFYNVKLWPTGIFDTEATIEYNLNSVTSFSP